MRRSACGGLPQRAFPAPDGQSSRAAHSTVTGTRAVPCRWESCGRCSCSSRRQGRGRRRQAKRAVSSLQPIIGEAATSAGVSDLRSAHHRRVRHEGNLGHLAVRSLMRRGSARAQPFSAIISHSIDCLCPSRPRGTHARQGRAGQAGQGRAGRSDSSAAGPGAGWSAAAGVRCGIVWLSVGCLRPSVCLQP